jgi:hypothetical protein
MEDELCSTLMHHFSSGLVVHTGVFTVGLFCCISNSCTLSFLRCLASGACCYSCLLTHLAILFGAPLLLDLCLYLQLTTLSKFLQSSHELPSHLPYHLSPWLARITLAPFLLLCPFGSLPPGWLWILLVLGTALFPTQLHYISCEASFNGHS